MEARLRRMGDVTVISISGSLTIEETQPFREVCVRKFAGQKVIFNMQRANFVGSTGIQAFLETLQSMDPGAQHGVRMVGVRTEFKRIISNLESQKIEFFEDDDGALRDWLLPCVPGSTAGSNQD